ncbi:DUF3499 family protein [Gulosibacter bifidus]|uniref:DUF3499 family protein n=1 Tax=Gulosibacter bifidus TaxID=272239 RepID=A0ABW5RI98_9MICO|nr:DUF3499 family protein [Gulosibacter bifidus]
MRSRTCARVSCSRKAQFTLTFDYTDKMVAIGPLSFRSDPHSYDLCPIHAERTTPPEGWTMMRPASLGTQPPRP